MQHNKSSSLSSSPAINSVGHAECDGCSYRLCHSLLADPLCCRANHAITQEHETIENNNDQKRDDRVILVLQVSILTF